MPYVTEIDNEKDHSGKIIFATIEVDAPGQQIRIWIPADVTTTQMRLDWYAQVAVDWRQNNYTGSNYQA